MVGLAFAVAASANFPALLLALSWRRFNTTGAVTGVLFGVISSIGLVIISPAVWPGADAEGGAFGFYDLENPGIVSIPLGFIGCWLGTMLGPREEEPEREFDELYVRSETGLGAEEAEEGAGLRPRRRARGGRSRGDDPAPAVGLGRPTRLRGGVMEASTQAGEEQLEPRLEALMEKGRRSSRRPRSASRRL